MKEESVELEELDSPVMDVSRLQQLNVINQMRRLAKPADKYTIWEILEHAGISEGNYLKFGEIWRELGSAGS